MPERVKTFHHYSFAFPPTSPSSTNWVKGNLAAHNHLLQLQPPAFIHQIRSLGSPQEGRNTAVVRRASRSASMLSLRCSTCFGELQPRSPCPSCSLWSPLSIACLLLHCRGPETPEHFIFPVVGAVRALTSSSHPISFLAWTPGKRIRSHVLQCEENQLG